MGTYTRMRDVPSADAAGHVLRRHLYGRRGVAVEALGRLCHLLQMACTMEVLHHLVAMQDRPFAAKGAVQAVVLPDHALLCPAGLQ